MTVNLVLTVRISVSLFNDDVWNFGSKLMFIILLTIYGKNY